MNFERERNLDEKELKEQEEENEENKSKKEKKPEDSIPDLPENKKAREFLKKAPTKGLWLPMGTEVKVMQCFRCKAYGHRSGDRECPLREQGNVVLDSQRQAREDPMSSFVAKNNETKREQQLRVYHLKRILEEIKDIQKQYKKSRKSKHKKEKHKKSKKN